MAVKANVMRNRNYALLFWGDFVSQVGSTLFSFAVSFYILKITGNNALIQGTFLAVGGIFRLLPTPVGGVLADRFHKGKIMYTCDFISGGTILASALAILLFRDSVSVQLVILFAATILLNATASAFSPASGSILRFLVAEDEYQQASSYFSVSQSFVSILGVLAAGVLYGMMGIVPIMLLDGVSFILSAISEIFIRYEHHPVESEFSARAIVSDMKDGLRYVVKLKPILAMSLIALGLNFFLNPVFSNGLVYFCSTKLQGDFLFSSFMTKETWLAASELMLSTGMLVSSVIISRRPQPDRCAGIIKRTILYSSLLLAGLSAAYLLFGARGKVNVFLVIMSVLMLAVGAVLPKINIRTSVIFMKQISPDMLGKTAGLLSTLSMALIPLASFVGGVLIQSFGLATLFLFSTIGFAAMTVFAMLNKSIDEL